VYLPIPTTPNEAPTQLSEVDKACRLKASTWL